jgi:hypothetical protein
MTAPAFGIRDEPTHLAGEHDGRALDAFYHPFAHAA